MNDSREGHFPLSTIRFLKTAVLVSGTFLFFSTAHARGWMCKLSAFSDLQAGDYVMHDPNAPDYKYEITDGSLVGSYREGGNFVLKIIQDDPDRLTGVQGNLLIEPTRDWREKARRMH